MRKRLFVGTIVVLGFILGGIILIKGGNDIFVILCFLIVSLLFLYLLKGNSGVSNGDKIIIWILESIIITFVSFGLLKTSFNIIKSNDNSNNKYDVILDKSNVVSDKNINLSSIDSDVTIVDGGSYTLKGNFKHSIIIDSDEEVKLILNNVDISNDKTAGIICVGTGNLTIILNDGTHNVISDGGNSQYDGAIYSMSDITFSGSGYLVVNGNQIEGEGIATENANISFNGGSYNITSVDDGINAGGDGGTITINDGEFYVDAGGDGIDSNQNAVINGGTVYVMGSDTGGDSGIDTDDGYIINGGLVIALGSDMIETPENNSGQKTMAFVLDSAISKDTLVTLLSDDQIITSFVSGKSFRTLIISSDRISDKNYSLYIGGTNSGTLNNGIYDDGEYNKGNLVSINNNSTFNVSDVVNLYGTERRR